MNTSQKSICDTQYRSDLGTTVMELLVGLSMLIVFLAGVAGVYSASAKNSLDTEIIAHTDETARTILDMMVFDARMIGAGMPLAQDDFLPGGDGLEDSPLAVFEDSDDEFLHFRMNETGSITFLAADYTPDEGSLSFSVVSVSDFATGDQIYISDATAGGSDGLHGLITSIVGTQVSIDSDYIASEDAIFPVGSTVARITEVEYTSPDDDNGITRNNGISEVVLAQNTTFEIEYLDSSGSEIELPLDEDKISDQLAALRITVSAESKKPLRTGEEYTAEAEQIVAIRNL